MSSLNKIFSSKNLVPDSGSFPLGYVAASGEKSSQRNDFLCISFTVEICSASSVAENLKLSV